MKAASYLFWALALAATVTTIVFTKDTLAFLDGALSAEGVVTGHQPHYDPDSDSTTYYPTIRFRTAAGQQIDFVSDSGSSFKFEEIGERVELRYRPENPQDARTPGFFGTSTAAAIFALAFGGSALITRKMARAAAGVRVGPPAAGSSPGTVAQWSVVLKSGHEKLYRGVAYGALALGVICIGVTVAVAMVSRAFAPWMAAPGLIGLIALLAAAKFVPDVRRNTTTRAKVSLRDSGRAVPARVTGAVEVGGLTVGEARTYRLLAEGADPETGGTTTFESGYVWSTTPPAVDDQPVTVWIDPDRPGRYWLDLETLGKV